MSFACIDSHLNGRVMTSVTVFRNSVVNGVEVI